jgi:hypothetical protein
MEKNTVSYRMHPDSPQLQPGRTYLPSDIEFDNATMTWRVRDVRETPAMREHREAVRAFTEFVDSIKTMADAFGAFGKRVEESGALRLAQIRNRRA